MAPRIILLIVGFLFCLPLSTVSAKQPEDIDCSVPNTFCTASLARQDVQAAAASNGDSVVVVSSLTSDNIQNAIRQVAAAGGGTVYLPAGTLHDAGNIDTVNGVEIIGSCTDGPPCDPVMNVRDPQTQKWGPLPTTVFTGTVTFRGNIPFSSDPAPVYNATDPDKVLRISAIRFNTKEGFLITTRGAKLFRFDHIDFDYPEETCSPSVLRYVASIDQEPAADSAYDAYSAMGVIDHNNSFCGDYMWYLGPRLRGDQCRQLGAANTDPTGYPDAIYLEDNYFEDFGHPVASFGSVNYVVRHNYFTARAATGGWEYGLDAHGPGYHEIWGENYGGCVTEIYNNTFTQEGLEWAGTHMRLRSGRGVIYNNTIENSGYPGRFVAEDCNRALSMGLDQCFDTPHQFYMWDNNLNNVSESRQFNIEANCGACIGPEDLIENTPMPGYTAYEYPHRLISRGTVPNPPTGLKLIAE